jgi:hypothetical protein
MTVSDSGFEFILFMLLIVIPYCLWATVKGIKMYLRRRKQSFPKRY